MAPVRVVSVADYSFSYNLFDLSVNPTGDDLEQLRRATQRFFNLAMEAELAEFIFEVLECIIEGISVEDFEYIVYFGITFFFGPGSELPTIDSVRMALDRIDRVDYASEVQMLGGTPFEDVIDISKVLRVPDLFIAYAVPLLTEPPTEFEIMELMDVTTNFFNYHFFNYFSTQSDFAFRGATLSANYTLFGFYPGRFNLAVGVSNAFRFDVFPPGFSADDVIQIGSQADIVSYILSVQTLPAYKSTSEIYIDQGTIKQLPDFLGGTIELNDLFLTYAIPQVTAKPMEETIQALMEETRRFYDLFTF